MTDNAAQTPLLEVRQLQTCFGPEPQPAAVVDKIDFTLNRGETLVLLGESGSGKSISALSVMRLLPAAAKITGGQILLEGKNLLKIPESRMRRIRGRRIAMIFQEPQSALNPVLTAGRQIGEVLQYHKDLTGKEQLKKSIELLEAVGIPDPERRIHEYPHQFSGGMKQRIMIAIALAGEPDLLIADEPTTALDVTTQAQVLELLKTLQNRSGMAILFITHDLGITAQIADRIAVMKDGKIVEAKQRDALIEHPAHDYTKKLFDAVPSRKKRGPEWTQTTFNKSSEPPLLSVQNLTIHFPIRKGLFRRVVDHVKAVDGVDINIHAGQTVAIVGESGSGKTTMGKGILRLLDTANGKITFDGADLGTLNPAELRGRRRDMQIIFQDPYSSMNPRMMVNDIIQEGMAAQNIGRSRTERGRRVDNLLMQVGLLPEHKYRYPHEFSGGQRQRICIARALAVEPKLIICDEPTSALDVSVQAQILTLLNQLQRQLGIAYLFITHNMGVVEYIAHHVAVMHRGKIVEQGQADEILLHPQHPYTRELLAAVPVIA